MTMYIKTVTMRSNSNKSKPRLCNLEQIRHEYHHVQQLAVKHLCNNVSG